MKNFTRCLYVKKLMLLSLIVLSSKVQADITSVLNGGDSTKNFTSLDTAVATVDTVVDSILVDTGTTIPGLIGTPAADVSADIAAVKVDTAAVLVDTGTTIPGTISTLQTDATAILADTAVIGTPALASDIATALAYVIANVQVNPNTQVNNAKGLAELTTTVALAGAPATATTDAMALYETDVDVAIVAAAVATTLATQSNANTVLAITDANAAIAEFDTFMSALIVDAGYPATVYIDSASGEGAVKWGLDQLLWSLNQLKAQQATS